jgi:hypothetical protein
MKKSVIMVLALTALFGCSKMEQEVGVDANGNPVGEVPVKLTGVIEGTASTRGDGVLNAIPSGGLDLDIFRVNSSDAGTYGSEYDYQLDATMASSGAITFTESQKFNSNAAIKGSFIALYPKATGATWTYTPSGRTITGTLDGSTDLLSSALVQGDKDNATLTLTFGHLLTRIDVKVQGAENDDLPTVQSLWGKVKKIEVVGQPTAVTLTLPVPGTGIGNKAALTATTPTTDFELKAVGGTAASALTIPAYATNPTTTFGYAMLAPITTNTAIKLRVYTESLAAESTKYKEVTTTAQTFTAGLGYVITLTFSIANGGGVDVSVGAGTALTPWDGQPSMPYDVP